MTLPPAELAAMRSYAALPFAPSGATANPPSTDATPWSTPPALVSPPADASAPATSFGLGMRLSSAPLSMPPRPPDEPPWSSQSLEKAEEDDEIDTVQARESVAPGDVPRPPARVVVPPPRTMVARAALRAAGASRDDVRIALGAAASGDDVRIALGAAASGDDARAALRAAASRDRRAALGAAASGARAAPGR